ncbi:hypothetical protein [uncultured Clostridium sp.]|uniref:hypothetical protein n=1 Tax=uncultured Clostridium sp. TaxID=59620 RepID=UPI00262894FF|nr:hypothetical protein [uncultured Clostridium sp.]
MKYLKNIKSKWDEFIVKQMMKSILIRSFKEKQLENAEGKTIEIEKITFNKYCAIVKVDLNFVCSIQELEEKLEYIKDIFKANSIKLEKENNDILIYIQLEQLQFKNYEYVKLSPYECLLGFNIDGNIIVDMKKTAHLFISGLSLSGKTEMAKTIINNLRGADTVLINIFKADFQKYNGRVVNGEEAIEKYLRQVLENKTIRKRPLYLIIDETPVLSRNKKIEKLIAEILMQGRHYNIFLIVIAQSGEKETVKFKNLFNARACFRQVEESQYRVVLGSSVADTKLKPREFYLYSDAIYKGITFTN